jgi:excisionase family DNA binding protein
MMSKLDPALPGILTIEDVAGILRIPVTTARKLTRGDPPALKSKKVGKHIRIAKTDLERYLK